MPKKKQQHFWSFIARMILRNRLIFLSLLILFTIFLGFQWKHINITQSEANLLPDNHIENQIYNQFKSHFGDEGNVMIVGSSELDSIKQHWEDWSRLRKKLTAKSEILFVLSTDNWGYLVKDTLNQKFGFETVDSLALDAKETMRQLLEKQPFYKGLLYNEAQSSVRMLVYLDKEILDTKVRKQFLLHEFTPIVEAFEQKTGVELHVSGMPYIRTMNSKSMMDEIGLFIGAALLLTSFIFFLFFRSFRATLLSIIVVSFGVMWAFGFLGLFQYKITVLSAIIPPLIIVIGIPNCIFLINKYQQEIKKHGQKAMSLTRVITRVGNATLLTNCTTAAGFATFILTQSKILNEFGILASVCILSLFVISLIVIPIAYSYMKMPKSRHLKHLNKKWMDGIVNWMMRTVKKHRIRVYVYSIIILILGIIGVYNIKVSGSMIEDMPKGKPFFKDIRYFEQSFNGVLPLEISIDTKKEKGVLNYSTIKRMDRLEEFIKGIPELAEPFSVVKLVKQAKQAYYNGNPEFYSIPTNYEKNFILSYAKNNDNLKGLFSSYVDTLGQHARMTTFLKDVSSERVDEIEKDLRQEIAKIFPQERYTVQLTGKALLFSKGTDYLIKNLIISLIFAILLIAIFMAIMFKSWQMIIISLIPNLLPLLMTAGLMGFFGVPLKPSTILIFSIAFGISVDDTIHFLAKYRQELIRRNWDIKPSVYAALKETGVSMFYTSVVLFFGFSVFMISSFGGTVALGGLVSITLLFAMMANLVLLPSLLLSLEKSISNKRVLKKPTIQIVNDEEEGDR